MLGALQSAFREPALLPKGGDALSSLASRQSTALNKIYGLPYADKGTFVELKSLPNPFSDTTLG